MVKIKPVAIKPVAIKPVATWMNFTRKHFQQSLLGIDNLVMSFMDGSALSCPNEGANKSDTFV